MMMRCTITPRDQKPSPPGLGRRQEECVTPSSTATAPDPHEPRCAHAPLWAGTECREAYPRTVVKQFLAISWERAPPTNRARLAPAVGSKDAGTIASEIS